MAIFGSRCTQGHSVSLGEVVLNIGLGIVTRKQGEGMNSVCAYHSSLVYVTSAAILILVLTCSGEILEVAILSQVCWLDVRGSLDISELSPEVVYEIVYVFMLTEAASGWELPIRLILALPDGRVQASQVSLLEKPRGQWMELSVGNFQRKNGELGEVSFIIREHGGHWKQGLVIKGAVIRPIQTTL